MLKELYEQKRNIEREIAKQHIEARKLKGITVKELAEALQKFPDETLIADFKISYFGSLHTLDVMERESTKLVYLPELGVLHIGESVYVEPDSYSQSSVCMLSDREGDFTVQESLVITPPE